MRLSQAEKAKQFRDLHRAGCFVLPNAWDAGSAKILAGLGFRAIATSSAASACALGMKDGELTRGQAMEHTHLIAAATELPVSADLENGFGGAPEDVATTIRQAAQAGAVGCTIEDSTGDSATPLYDAGLATERIHAAVEAARELDFPFTLTARAHNLLYEGGTLEETIERLLAYERAGADVLFAPGLADIRAVRAACSALSKPFNFMAGIARQSFGIAELAEAGVRRVSLSTALYRAAMFPFVNAAREALAGRFEFIDKLGPTSALTSLMPDHAAR